MNCIHVLEERTGVEVEEHALMLIIPGNSPGPRLTNFFYKGLDSK